MSDSIENDTGFAEVLGRFTKEFIKFNNCTTVKAGFLQTEMLTGELSCSLLKAQKEFKSKCESARDQLFEYIDRRVERAVLEERKVQEVGKLKELYKKFDEDRNNEKLRLDCNGNCVFNFKELPLHLFDDLNGLLIQEIIKIDPALLMIKDHSLGFEGLFIESVLELEERTIVVFFRFDGMRLELRFKSNNGLIEINLPEIVKYFSDEVNKIVFDKYINI